MQMLKSLIQSKGGEMIGGLGDEDDAAAVPALASAGGGGGEPAMEVDAERANMIKQMVSEAGAALYGDYKEGDGGESDGDGDAYWRQRLAQERGEGGKGLDPASAVVDAEEVVTQED
jgi:hypothetical protein